MRALFPLPALLALILLSGCCCLLSGPQIPPPMNLTFSESLDPSLSLYTVDKDSNRIASIDSNDWFYPVQRGLPAGTLYAFRLLRPNGEVVVPANENFTALPAAEEPKFQAGLQQYQGHPPGKYSVELVRIDGTRGIIVARTPIRLTRSQSAPPELLGMIAQNCSQFLPEGGGVYPSMEAPGATRLYECIKGLAMAENDAEICKGLPQYINNTFLYIDWCLGDYAVNKSDLSLCAKRGRAVDRAICRNEVLGNYGECSAMECDFYWSCDQQREICLQSFALSHQNATLCRQVQDGEMRNRCLGLVLKDRSYCGLIQDNESRSSCLSYIDNSPPGARGG